ncbi:MAG: hypothetical protein HY606_04785 [Planctomycetes bacterium]|nr:hypothetical protein [Planctomycetota bacterium]
MFNVLVLFLTIVPIQNEKKANKKENVIKKGGYIVVVSDKTQNDKAWAEVVRTLEKKHNAVICISPLGSLGDGSDMDGSEALKKILSEYFPKYLCFVALPEECTREFVIAVHRLTRQLDDDPYGDCLWGIITGYDAETALRIAEMKTPLKIVRGAAGCGLDLSLFKEGIWFSECTKPKITEKKRNGKIEERFPEKETTELIVKELNENNPQVFFTSGHANQKVWELGYDYPNGVFFCKNGRLLAKDLQGKIFEINSHSPKVYAASGNCLAGYISEKDCMALAWMRTGGVYQLVGYTVSTWHGFMGWGINDYFLRMGGQHSFSESFYLNNQALIYQLETRFPSKAKINIDKFNIEDDRSLLDKLAQQHEIIDQDNLGLLWDRDTVAFYGDPAWDARLTKVVDPSYEIKLDSVQKVEGKKVTDVVKIDIQIKITSDVEFGQRPPIVLLPYRIKDPVLVEKKSDLKPLITDNFVLIPLEGKQKKGQIYKIQFAAKKM